MFKKILEDKSDQGNNTASSIHTSRNMEGRILFFIIGLNFCGSSPVDSGEKTAIQCNQDEVFSHCVNGGCDARNCSQLSGPVPCFKLDPKHCAKGCVCKPGYLRGNGGCVEKEQCHKEICTGPHEYFACGGACDNVCATLHEQSQESCPIRNIKCNERCYCEEGYARDAGGVCVPIQQCTL